MASDPIQRARELVRELAEQGRPRWRTSIPARPEEDCDLVLSAGLEAAVERAEAAERERDDLQAALARERGAVVRVLRWAKETLLDLGNGLGCDHDAGICFCAYTEGYGELSDTLDALVRGEPEAGAPAQPAIDKES